MQTIFSSVRRLVVLLSRLFACALALSHAGSVVAAQSALVAPVRAERLLTEGWRFSLDEQLDAGRVRQPDFDDTQWKSIRIPHTWNALDGQSLTTSYRRGLGFYRLHFNAPVIAGKRHFIEFGAVSLRADVWLNGIYLGQHQGGFSRFRFDLTDALKPGDKNVLVVQVDNSKQVPGAATEHILPFSGDFNLFGGIYRDVRLISTSTAHIDTLDFGSQGVAVTTESISPDQARLAVTTRLVTTEPHSKLSLRTRLLDHQGRTVASDQQALTLVPAAAASEIRQQLRVAKPHLWQGRDDPYLYGLVVDLCDKDGRVLDRVQHRYGVRQFRFDRDQGFYLNGKSYPLHGVARHQDVLDHGWAISQADQARDMALMREIGANTVRLSHYQHDQHIVDLADEFGLIVYPEIPLVNTAVNSEDATGIAPGTQDNARQQLTELIKQNQHHASVAMWGIANELGFVTRYTPKAYPAMDALVHNLRDLAHVLDPSRPTVQADVKGRPSFSAGEDLAALNRYQGWYDRDLDGLVRDIAQYRSERPTQPIGLSEYGSGASVTQHTDEPRAIQAENLVTSGKTPVNPPTFMPEEYQAYQHEQVWQRIQDKPYIWGTYIWNMFDFASKGRQEGDYLKHGLSLNNKGVVTADRAIRKDAFYFYKSVWNPAPMLHLTSQRYTLRSYPVTDVKVYARLDQDTLRLSVGATALGAPSACEGTVCVWKEVRLAPGDNVVRVTGKAGGKSFVQTAQWQYADVSQTWRINAGAIAPFDGFGGARWGSDAFLTAPSYASSIGSGNRQQLSLEQALQIAASLPKSELRNELGEQYANLLALDPEIFRTWREGRFTYDVPVGPGAYRITLSFFEPARQMVAGARVFTVSLNGKPVLPELDLVAQAGAPMTALVKTVDAVAVNGRLRLDFIANKGKALVAGIHIARLDPP